MVLAAASMTDLRQCLCQHGVACCVGAPCWRCRVGVPTVAKWVRVRTAVALTTDGWALPRRDVRPGVEGYYVGPYRDHHGECHVIQHRDDGSLGVYGPDEFEAAWTE